MNHEQDLAASHESELTAGEGFDGGGVFRRRRTFSRRRPFSMRSAEIDVASAAPSRLARSVSTSPRSPTVALTASTAATNVRPRRTRLRSRASGGVGS